MFSHGLSSLKKAASTDTRFTCLRTARGWLTTSQPNTVACPESGVRRVPRMRMSVDLPLPLGPRMPVTPPASMTRLSGSRATLSSHEGGDIGRLAPRLVATRRARMPGAHERLQQDGALRLRDGSQLCDPFRRLPVRDARVVERASREQRGIVGRPDVVVRRVRLDVLV